MDIKYKINHIDKNSCVESFLHNISVENKNKILQFFKLKNIKTIYDLIFAVSFFKFTNYNENTLENADVNNKLNQKVNIYRNIFHISNNNKLKKESDNKVNFHDDNAYNLERKTNNGDSNNFIDLSENVIKNTISTNIHENNNMINAEHGNIMEIKEMYEYYETMKENKSNNITLSYFDIYINLDVISLFPITNNDKEKLTNCIYSIIETNDISLMCIYLNLGHLLEKFELFNIKNIESLKKLIESKKFECIKNEMNISLYEFILIVNFIVRIKKKRIFCNNIFNQYNKHFTKNNKENRKTICDKIHQFIEFDKWTFKNIIDNPFFQRLRNLSQLGACQYVYPGATHTRFEHSLGVGFLSAKYFTHLCNRSNLSPYHGELNRMLRCVQIAGLCHDLGHGPFSHTFESYFINYKKNDTEHKWNHASMSQKIAEHIVENLIDQDEVLDVSDVKIIKKLIIGPQHYKKSFGLDPIDSLIEASYDIICNNRNGLDTDKFDYLQRDATIAPPNGTLPSLNCNRILCQSAAINGCITYNVKEIHPVWTVYMNRFSLFKQVYTHRKVRAMELMLCDGFRLADDFFRWSECLDDLDFFLNLTDSSIIYDIKKRAKTCKYDENVKNSLNLINSVICDRNSEYAYKYISEINVTEPKLIKYLKEITNEEKIARYSHGLSPDDIIIDWNYLNYGMGKNDPLDFVYFYSSDNEEEAFIAHKEYRGTHPRYFEECNVRLYCKNKKVAHLAKEAHLKFISNEVFSKASPCYKKKEKSK
ncbi:HD superfamily phosphohydrolase protein, putative [Plasmodium gallinaceum]|uniref:HD superfamily phosphohydrolase protein, putative n=1 Tax=Plasmodium gallinaceum TaxID=5849 RepID=A0A1J1GWU0_PLAGA|nr:HD superfamily phosphohydrolase protein, putative [Plasmodium gallinaceum]CRG97027.1 HD superfamily phosphohydrolase protein, putative [Plasmodium gallinaceum]